MLSLKSDKVAESIKTKSPLLGGIGAAIVVGSIVGLYFTYTNPIMGGQYLLLWALTTLLGLYITLYQFTSFFIELARKNRTYYYRRLLFLTSLDYKFKQLTAILMLVTVMIMVTILYSTIILHTYTLTEKKAVNANPYDIAFIQTESKNNLATDELYSIIDQKENPVQKHLEVPIYSYYQKTYNRWYNNYNFMPVGQFNELTSNQVELQGKEFIYYLNDDSENRFDVEYNQKLVFPVGKEEKTFTRKDILVKKNINTFLNLHDFIIVSNSEFARLKNGLDGFESKINLINVANWKETANVVEKLENIFNNYNENTPPITDARVENTSEENIFQIASKVEHYNRNKSSNGILFFVTTILSVIFFFGSFILLYLNLFSEIDKEKIKFKKLHNIGITVKEVKQIISREITTLFFIPTFVGTILAFLYVVAMATDIGGVIENPDILLHFLIVAGIYHIIQIGFYLYARKRMFAYLAR